VTETKKLLKVRCPSCKGWASWKENPFRPFCGENCKNRDLGKWAMGDYRIPVEEENPSEEEVASPQKREKD
jgi:endogenous inhibitor of DNA gyrase (YacG/DUF329 family)